MICLDSALAKALLRLSLVKCPKSHKSKARRNSVSVETIIIIIISLFQEDNIFGMNASLTYGP